MWGVFRKTREWCIFQVYYHIVGTEQSQDVLCYEDKENQDWIL